MPELLREFAEYTPHFLIRLIADGASAVLWFMPNIVGLLFYALIVNLVIEKVTSLIGSVLVSLRVFQWFRTPQIPIATPRARIGAFLPLIAKNALKTWIGLPVLYVLSLILSDEGGAREEFRQLVSGYAWQEGATAQIPLYTWLNFSHNSFLQVATSIIVAFLYANNAYVYYANGFFATKKIREVSDLLFSITIGADGSAPTPERINVHLRNQGWTDDAAKSALWFLFLRNVRIFSQNSAYDQMGPQQYGLFRAVGSLGITLGLLAISPLIAVLKVYFEKNDIGEVRRTLVLYQKHLARLPEPIQAKLKQVKPSGAGASGPKS